MKTINFLKIEYVENGRSRLYPMKTTDFLNLSKDM